jgi:hypothetical protein
MPRPAAPSSDGVASSRVVWVTLGVWLAAAFLVSASGRAATLKPPWPQVVILTLTVTTLLAGRLWQPVREWARLVDIRVPVALHLCRFVGIYFIHLAGQGALPESFALPAGVGDAAVATSAAVLLISGSPDTPKLRAAYLIWNVCGLVDIGFVVASAARHGLVDPASMRALLVLPLALLPLFIVPLVIATHVLVFVRLRRP